MSTRLLTRATGPILIVVLAGGLLQSATPIFWRVGTQAEFLRGEIENLTVDDAGRLRLGPTSDVIYDTTMPVLWSVARQEDTLWVGSGNDGRVFRVDATGRGMEVFDADELDVHAVVPAGPNRVYAASSPRGKVYELASGSDPRVVFDPAEQYIWALAPTPAGDGLFVATGEPGRIYRLDADGNATLFYETRTTHVLSLALDSDGTLWAGTGSPGRVFRISEDARGFVVLDSRQGEIRALRLAGQGRIYAVGVGESVNGRPSPPPAEPPSGGGAVSPPPSTSSPGATVVTVTATATPVPTSPAPTTSAGGQGAVYRIEPDGVWDIVWESSTDTPYDVLPARPGEEPGLLVATGPSGKIFRVLTDPAREILLTRVAAQQVTRFVTASDGGVFYITANPGKVHRLSATPATEGSYVSEVRDAATVATWGTVRWRATTPAGTRVRLRTRSGNTDEPNDTWSPWSAPYEDGRGSAITSPKARYIQWKAELSGGSDTPTLLGVTTAYLPRNLRPKITTLTVHEPGVAFQQPFPGNDPPIAGLGVAAEARHAAANGAATDSSPSALGRRVYRKGLQTFVWSASDDNGDDLAFDVLYRGEAETEWRPLVTGSRSTVFAWDTTTTPDGTYLVRIVATDVLSNAPGAALTGYVDSAPFDIDNTAPEIAVGTARRETADTVVPFVVRDASSPIQRVEYSLDTERWQVVYPLDGIPDSQQERFEVTVPTDALARLVIRASDGLGNTATAAGS